MNKITVKNGDIFGKLTAVEDKKYPHWLFKCFCGKEKVINKYDVVNGNTNSCGCETKKDRLKTRVKKLELKLKGKIFNSLKIIDFAYTKNGKSYWNCVCVCDNKVTLGLNNIKSGGVRSCGCLRTHKIQPGESGLKSLYSKYKVSAKKEHREFDLTLEEFKNITSQDCAYCGESPSKISTAEHTKKQGVKEYTAYLYNGIDRVDSNKGYEKNNVVPCCLWCNIIKRERTVEELKNHITRIYNNLK